MSLVPKFSPVVVLSALLTSTLAAFRTRAALQLEILALRHQLGVLQRSVKKPQLVGLASALAIIVAGKQYFRSATSDDLRWLLAPTAKCVSVLTRSHFTHEVGVGYVDRDVNFAIAPVRR